MLAALKIRNIYIYIYIYPHRRKNLGPFTGRCTAANVRGLGWLSSLLLASLSFRCIVHEASVSTCRPPFSSPCSLSPTAGDCAPSQPTALRPTGSRFAVDYVWLESQIDLLPLSTCPSSPLPPNLRLHGAHGGMRQPPWGVVTPVAVVRGCPCDSGLY
jgi:hypothetical protein